MLFLADESCDFAVVRALRAAGHDVIAVAEISPAAEDSSVADLAVRQRRILLTEDKDFGQLVFASMQATEGVIFIRFHASARSKLPGVIVDLVRDMGDELAGAFAVVQPGRVRISRAAEQ